MQEILIALNKLIDRIDDNAYGAGDYETCYSRLDAMRCFTDLKKSIKTIEQIVNSKLNQKDIGG